MRRAESQIRIDRSIDDVWQLIGRPDQMASYHPAMTKTEYVSGKEAAVGALMRWDYSVGSRTGHFIEEIVAYDPPNQIAFENRGGEKIPPFRSVRTGFSLVADGDTTQLTATIDFKLKGLWALFEGSMVKRYEKDVLPELLASAKEACEAR